MSEQNPPIAENGSTNAAVCCGHCGHVVADGGNRCPRCQVWLPGNTAAAKSPDLARFLRTGEVPEHVRAALPEHMRMTPDDFVAELISDQGGADSLSALRRAHIRTARNLYAGAQMFMAEVTRSGVHTKAGRDAYDRYLASCDRLFRVGQLLGLDRRQRRQGIIELTRRAHEQENP